MLRGSDGGSKHLRTDGQFLHDYTEHHPRRQSSPHRGREELNLTTVLEQFKKDERNTVLFDVKRESTYT